MTDLESSAPRPAIVLSWWGPCSRSDSREHRYAHVAGLPKWASEEIFRSNFPIWGFASGPLSRTPIKPASDDTPAYTPPEWEIFFAAERCRGCFAAKGQRHPSPGSSRHGKIGSMDLEALFLSARIVAGRQDKSKCRVHYPGTTLALEGPS